MAIPSDAAEKERDTRLEEPHAARLLILSGRVQGLGVRPTIYRLATQLGLVGAVQNTARGVEISIEGGRAALGEFTRRLPSELPPGAVLERCEIFETSASGYRTFTIITESPDGPLSARLPVDMAVCGDCLSEIRNPDDRRFRYPFTSCTACGPRFTVIRKMPYERRDTSMVRFTFCSPCRHEYELAGERRFHAQTNACPDCGPRVWAADAPQRTVGAGEDSLPLAIQALRRGRIVALRGLGGYQLLADATDEDAVVRLRQRKRRRGKPLAVMVENLSEALAWADIGPLEQETLCDRSNPIVLLRARTDRRLARSVHPSLDTVGLMLPTTPLHAILARDFARPLVCTSGNREGDPLDYEIEAAERNLSGVCDLWLHHDRPIERPIDDSVVRVIADRVVTIRLARGLAPLPLDLERLPPTLAAGGFFKSAMAWSNGAQSVLGPHIGDQDTVTARERYVSQWSQWQELYRCEPQRIAHDLHPEYFSTEWAQAQELRCVAVQHHHAHVVSGMFEHGWLDQTVLGVAWDGTGYGTDGTIWGGEFLVCCARGFERFARLRPFRLPGGEAAIREPWRIALSVVADALGRAEAGRLTWPDVDPALRERVLAILDHPHWSPQTSSAGRLFDAAAAIALGMARVEFEGQAAMILESMANRQSEGAYSLPLGTGELPELDWRPMFSALVCDCRAGVEPSVVSARFHRGLAEAIVRVCQQRPALPVVLSGGVFQNRLLTEWILESNAELAGRVGTPGIIPPNDGGLAAGQLAVAAMLEEVK